MDNYYFDTNGFQDTQEKRDETGNDIGGFKLANTLRAALLAGGCDCEEVFAEDYGWAFTATLDGTSYLVTASVDPNEEAEQEAHLTSFANINVVKERSFWDKLRGRNKPTPNDLAQTTVRQVLENHSDVVDLKYS